MMKNVFFFHLRFKITSKNFLGIFTQTHTDDIFMCSALRRRYIEFQRSTTSSRVNLLNVYSTDIYSALFFIIRHTRNFERKKNIVFMWVETRLRHNNWKLKISHEIFVFIKKSFFLKHKKFAWHFLWCWKVRSYRYIKRRMSLKVEKSSSSLLISFQ